MDKYSFDLKKGKVKIEKIYVSHHILVPLKILMLKI